MRIAAAALLALLAPEAFQSTVQAATVNDLPAWAQVRKQTPRRALVIGVSRYRFLPSLTTPANDANVVADKLGLLGFAVTRSAADPTRDQILQSLESFLTSLGEGDIAVIYFSGHGFERNGINYIVPSDVQRLEAGREGHIAVSVDFLLREVEKRRAALAVVVLDACRDDPFRDVDPISSTLIEPKGLAPVAINTTGMFIGFAAAPRTSSWGSFSDDAPGTPSIFTRHLARYLPEEGRSLYWIWNRVGEQVFRTTNQQQRPWQNASLFPELKLRPRAADLAEAEEAWVDLVSSSNQQTLVTDLEGYVRFFPDSPYAPAARAKLKELRSVQAPPTERSSVELTERLAQIALQTKRLEGALTSSSFVTQLSDFGAAVAADDLVVRDRPSDTANRVSTVERGTRLDALSLPDEQGWVAVRLQSGRTGFVGAVTTADSIDTEAMASLPFQPGARGTRDSWIGRLNPLVRTAVENGGHVTVDMSSTSDELPDRAATAGYLRAVKLRAMLVEQGLKPDQIQLRLLTRNPGSRDVASVSVTSD